MYRINYQLTLATRSGDVASTGVCSHKETIPDPGVLNSCSERPGLSQKAAAQKLCFLAAELPSGRAGWAVLTRWHCWLLHTPREPSPASQENPHSLDLPRELHPTPAGPLLHHSLVPYQNPQDETHSSPLNLQTSSSPKMSVLIFQFLLI